MGCEGECEYADACVGVGGVDGLGAGCEGGSGGEYVVDNEYVARIYA